MTRKCHNHTLQTNQGRREENTQSTNSHMTSGKPNKVKQSVLFPNEMLAKLERTLNTTQ